MKSGSAQRVKLVPFDELFGGGGEQAGEVITSVPLSQLHPFKNHPFGGTGAETAGLGG